MAGEAAAWAAQGFEAYGLLATRLLADRLNWHDLKAHELSSPAALLAIVRRVWATWQEAPHGQCEAPGGAKLSVTASVVFG